MLATYPSVKKVPFVSWNSFLKTDFPEGVGFDCHLRNARFGFLLQRCLCYLVYFRLAWSGSFLFCLHHPTLMMSFSEEVVFDCLFRNARSGFLRLKCLCRTLSQFACLGSFQPCSHHWNLKTSFPAEAVFECQFRNARFG